MKHYIAILCAITILSFTGSTFGDGDVNCPITSPDEANNLNLNDIMLDRLHKCFEKIGEVDFQTVHEVFSTEPRNIFKKYCQRKDLINDCLSTTSVSSPGCHNNTERIVGFVEDMLKTALSYGCPENGRHFGILMRAIFYGVNSTVDRNNLTDCFATAKAKVTKGNNPDISTKMQEFFHEIKEFKHCLTNKVRGINRAVFENEFMLNGILRSMKCLHPETGTIVLCETVDSSESINEKICPFVIDSQDDDLFFNLVSLCVVKNLNQLDFEHSHSFTKIAEYKTFYHTYCQNRPVILNCFGDLSSISKKCQNQTEDQLVDIQKDFYEICLKSGCKEDGEIFATMASGIFNSAERIVYNDTVETCIHNATESFKGVLFTRNSDEYPGLTMLFYTVFETLKHCVMQGAADVGSFKTVFDSFTNELLRAQKCIHPETRDIVLCKTLVNSIESTKKG